MTAISKDTKHAVAAATAAFLLAVLFDLSTNSLDTERFSWDFRYYVAMAEHGLTAPMASPFAYRFLTPMLAGALSRLFQMPTVGGFMALAYFGAVLQQLAVFLFTRWYTRSQRGAWFAMLATAFSLFNVKFLLFDPFRPDHLAYALILLQAYFALTRRFAALLLTTIAGCQIREFNVIPLLAYLCMSMTALLPSSDARSRRKAAVELLISLVGLAAALVLPRLLIPIEENFQFVSLSRDGMLRVVLAPFIPARDANFIYSLAAYLLPLLILASPGELVTAVRRIPPADRNFLGAYCAFVLIFSFLGGTDFYRFATYLLLPQSILAGTLAARRTKLTLLLVLAGVFIFNRLWLPFPMHDLESYLDFYGGSGTRFSAASGWRILELGALVGAGALFRRWSQLDDGLRRQGLA